MSNSATSRTVACQASLSFTVSWSTQVHVLHWVCCHPSHPLPPFSFAFSLSVQFSSVQFSHSVVSTLCDPMNRSTPGLPVHHQLPESTQTHVHWASDAIQPSHRLLSPSPPTLELSQHQGLFKWVSSLHQVAKVLEFQLQHQTMNTQDLSLPNIKSCITLSKNSGLLNPHNKLEARTNIPVVQTAVWVAWSMTLGSSWQEKGSQETRRRMARW